MTTEKKQELPGVEEALRYADGWSGSAYKGEVERDGRIAINLCALAAEVRRLRSAPAALRAELPARDFSYVRGVLEDIAEDAAGILKRGSPPVCSAEIHGFQVAAENALRSSCFDTTPQPTDPCQQWSGQTCPDCGVSLEKVWPVDPAAPQQAVARFFVDHETLHDRRTSQHWREREGYPATEDCEALNAMEACPGGVSERYLRRVYMDDVEFGQLMLKEAAEHDAKARARRDAPQPTPQQEKPVAPPKETPRFEPDVANPMDCPAERRKAQPVLLELVGRFAAWKQEAALRSERAETSDVAERNAIVEATYERCRFEAERAAASVGEPVRVEL